MDEWLRAWLAEELGAPVSDVAQLVGGMSTELNLISTVTGRQAVLRRYPWPYWSAPRARAAAAGERSALRHLEGSAVPAPRFIACSVEPEPVVLMGSCEGTRYAGDGLRIAGELGRVLAAIHAVPMPTGASDCPNTLVHNDFSISNVLVAAGRICAVVDWTEAAIGDPAGDVAFCFVSTWLTYGEAVADPQRQLSGASGCR